MRVLDVLLVLSLFLITNYLLLSLFSWDIFFCFLATISGKRSLCHQWSSRPDPQSLFWNLFCFARFWKVRTDGHTDHMFENSDYYWPWLCGSAEWIKKKLVCKQWQWCYWCLETQWTAVTYFFIFLEIKMRHFQGNKNTVLFQKNSINLR